MEVAFMLGAISLLLVAGLEYRMKMDMAENLHGSDVERRAEHGCLLDVCLATCLQVAAGIHQGAYVIVVISDFRSRLPDFLFAMELRPQYSPIHGRIFSCKRPIIQQGCDSVQLYRGL